VKFRIDQIRGNDATLSGIFFDPAPPTVDTQATVTHTNK